MYIRKAHKLCDTILECEKLIKILKNLLQIGLRNLRFRPDTVGKTIKFLIYFIEWNISKRKWT